MNKNKNTRFHHLDIGKRYPESTTYNCKACVDLLIVKMIPNERLGQNSKI